MAKNLDPRYSLYPQHTGIKFAPADTITDVDGATGTINLICTAPVDDTIVRNIAITSSDTANRDVLLFISNSATLTTGNNLIGIINVPAGAGFVSGIPSVNGMNSVALPFTRLDKDGNRVIFLKYGWFLKVGLKAALTAATKITVVTTSEDFS